MMRLLIGRAGSGKTAFSLEQIKKELQQGKGGPSLIYLVPEQAAFQGEYALVTTQGVKGSMRAQVLSFRRMAWRVLQETGGGRRLFIDDTGKGMVMRKILERKKSSLKIFRHAGDKPGIINELVRLYNELRRAGVSVFQLKEYADKQKQERSGNSILKEKLLEVTLILEEVEQELSTHYIDTEDYLLLLALKVPDSRFLQGSMVWVDGFYSFTQLEYLVLQALLRHVKELTVTLCLDRDYTPEEKVDELNPFYTTAFTCLQLQHLAARCGVPVEKIMLPQGEGARLFRFKDNPALAYLESNWHCWPLLPFTEKERADEFPLRLVAGTSRRSEVEAVAREIIALVRDKHFRYRDLAVIAHNLQDYGDLIAMVFRDYSIPFFLDQKKTILHHPLVEFIRSALEVINGNWRPDAIFRCIKSGFLYPVGADDTQIRRWRNRAAKLENYVLAFGIKGTHWQQEEMWRYTYKDKDTLEREEEELPDEASADSAFLQRLDKTRKHLSKPLLKFQDALSSSSLVKDKVKALFGLLQDVSTVEHLQLAASQARQAGEMEKARSQEQVYRGIVNLMDQLVDLLGEEEVSNLLFARLIDVGLSNLSLGLVPPSLDQVLVGNLERTRTGEVRALFLLGVNNDVLPSRPEKGAIFTEKEREILEELGFEQAAGPRRQLLDEQFLIYMALTRAREKLWVSYALADAEGKALLPSLLINRLKYLFPTLTEELISTEYQEDTLDYVDAGRLLSFLSHPRRTLSSLAIQLGRWQKGESINPLWWDVYNWYARGNMEKETVKVFLSGLFYRNLEEPLSPQTSRSLYGSKLRSSVSRLERFRHCPFAYFSAYGLRLKERSRYRLEAPDTGRFFHATLRNVARALQARGKHWGDCSREELLTLVSTETAKLLPRLQQEILLSTSRYKHIAKKIEDTVGRSVLYLAEHDRRSLFKPFAVEITFGEGGEIPPLYYILPDGSRLELTGRIDRLDVARGEEGIAYLRIIDYKMSKMNLNLLEVWHGLSLQLVLYLEAALAHAREMLKVEVVPAGIFYFHVHDPLISGSSPLEEDAVKAELLKRFRLRGKLLADLVAVKLMDSELLSGHSQIIPAAINKQGELYGGKSLLTGDGLALLRRHVSSLVVETGRDILEGRVEISPVSLKQKRACRFCPYKAVCQFDLLLEENRFHILQSGPEEKVFEWLKQSGCRSRLN